MSVAPIHIVGGGLAGLALGIALRRAGVPVRIDEAGDYPRHRVCGEFITGLDATTISALALDDALVDALPHRAVAWHLADGEPQLQDLPAPALGLSRYVLDLRLAENFIRLGGELRTHTRTTDLADAAGRVFANGRRRAASPAAAWLGLKVHVRALPLARDLEMHLGEDAYVGLTRVSADTVNLCGLFRRRPLTAPPPELLLAYLAAAGLGRLAARVRAADVVHDSFCAVAGLEFPDRTPDNSRLCLGDAHAMIPPFTGNGMAMAFQSAELALPFLVAYARREMTWPETRGATARALRGRFRRRLASADALHPFLLRRRRQRWFAALTRARLLPFRALYATLH